MNLEVLTVRLDPKIRTQLEVLARADERTVTHVIRKAIAEFINQSRVRHIKRELTIECPGCRRIHEHALMTRWEES